MSISKQDFTCFFADKILEDSTSVFLGAGISSQFGLPTWKELLTPCANRLGIDINEFADYYALSQYYANQFGKNALKREISRELQVFQSNNSTLDALLNLNFKSIWTTNYDTSVENCLVEKRIKFNKIHDDKDLANINSSDIPTIYKLNGDIFNLENIILTQEDWENYEYTHPTTITFLKKELVSNTFLFLGYSFTDNLVTKMLSSIRHYVGDSSNYHYTILKNNKSKEFQYFVSDLEKRYHIRTLLIDEYSEIPNIIEEIRDKVIEKNVFISGRLDDIGREVEDYACDLCKNLSIALLDNGNSICTGMGRKIGYFVSGPAIQHLLGKGMRNLNSRIQVRPFDDTMSPKQTKQYREYLIEGNHIVIFIFGQKFNEDGYQGSYGLQEEFRIAQEKGKVIIPIGSTGYESEQIWNYVKNNLIQYPYLEGYLELLGHERDAGILSKAVVNIINTLINQN